MKNEEIMNKYLKECIDIGEVVENLIDIFSEDEYESEEDKNKIKSITDEDKKQIIDNILNDDELNDKINETVRYYIFHK